MNIDHQRIATYFNFSPDHPETYPLQLFDNLLQTEKRLGHDEMLRVIYRMMIR